MQFNRNNLSKGFLASLALLGFAACSDSDSGGSAPAGTGDTSLPNMTVTVDGNEVSEGDTITVAEGGRNSTSVSVVLDEAPSQEITITVAHSSGDEDLQIYAGHGNIITSLDITFTADNWDTAQTATLVALSDDDTTDSTAEYTLTSSVTGIDTLTVTVQEEDDDVSSLVIAREDENGDHVVATSFGTPNDGSAFGYAKIKLDQDPGQEITITIERGDGDSDQGIYGFFSTPTFSGAHSNAESHDLVFDSTNWDTYQQIAFATFDDTGDVAGAEFSVSGTGVPSQTINTFPVVVADTTITGTITRQGFAAAADFINPVNDIDFKLSWKKVGTGTAAKYYGVYSDDDPLNQAPDYDGDPNGNPDRDIFEYPAYGFWHDSKLHFVTVKSVITQRSTTETNLICLVANDETFASGTGWLTATGSEYTTVGSYAISFTGSSATAEFLTTLIPVDADVAYPVLGADLQSSTYTPGAVGSANGVWEFNLLTNEEFLVDGSTTDADSNPAGTLQGIVFGSQNPSDLPGVIGVLEDGGEVYLYGLPFYSEADENFPFGALGGRVINIDDGTSDRLFLFLSFTEAN